jgi:hypothetical protein
MLLLFHDHQEVLLFNLAVRTFPIAAIGYHLDNHMERLPDLVYYMCIYISLYIFIVEYNRNNLSKINESNILFGAFHYHKC